METVMLVSMRYTVFRIDIEPDDKTSIDIVGFANIFQKHMVPRMKRIDISAEVSPMLSNVSVEERNRIAKVLIQRKLPIALREVCPDVELSEAMVETNENDIVQKHEWRI